MISWAGSGGRSSMLVKQVETQEVDSGLEVIGPYVGYVGFGDLPKFMALQGAGFLAIILQLDECHLSFVEEDSVGDAGPSGGDEFIC